MSIRLFLRSLRGRHDWRGSAAKRFVSGLKYVGRCLRMPARQAGWLQEVYGNARLVAMLPHDPRLLERWHHAYIHRGLGRSRRIEIIRAHFRYVFAHFPPHVIDAVYLQGRSTLGALTLKDGSDLLIELRRPTGRSREGELAVCLANAQGQVLSSMIVTIADDGRSLFIGCVQGAAAELGRDAVRDLTKQCHGLRPKNLLFSLVLTLGQLTNAVQVRGVSNLAHPFAREADKIKADYDSFWAECLGEPLADGFYALPAREAVRSEMDVESKHRSAFRKRELLRQEACALLAGALRDQPVPVVKAA